MAKDKYIYRIKIVHQVNGTDYHIPQAKLNLKPKFLFEWQNIVNGDLLKHVSEWHLKEEAALQSISLHKERVIEKEGRKNKSVTYKNLYQNDDRVEK